jgi:hypothetical protein
MFIVWGKKLVYRKIGHVADFCPICRQPRAFTLQRLGMANHVYYLTSGQGDLVGYERVCGSCHTAFEANPDTYAALCKKPTTLDALRRTTFPNLEQVCASRLALEEQIRSDPASLTREDRHLLIRSPFLLLSPKVEKRFASTHLDKEIGFAMAAALLLLLVGPALVRAIAPDHAEEAVLAFIAAGVLLVGWQCAMAGRRYMRRQIIPVLAGTLQPLRPGQEEIERVMNELKQLRHQIGSRCKPDDLLAQMRNSQA